MVVGIVMWVRDLELRARFNTLYNCFFISNSALSYSRNYVNFKQAVPSRELIFLLHRLTIQQTY